MIQKNSLTQIIIANIKDLTICHYRYFEIRVDILFNASGIIVVAEIDTFMKSRPDSLVRPPFYLATKFHPRVKDKTSKPRQRMIFLFQEIYVCKMLVYGYIAFGLLRHNQTSSKRKVLNDFILCASSFIFLYSHRGVQFDEVLDNTLADKILPTMAYQRIRDRCFHQYRRFDDQLHQLNQPSNSNMKALCNR